MKESEVQKTVFEELQAKASDVMPELGGLDVQQMEEQIKYCIISISYSCRTTSPCSTTRLSIIAGRQRRS